MCASPDSCSLMSVPGTLQGYAYFYDNLDPVFFCLNGLTFAIKLDDKTVWICQLKKSKKRLKLSNQHVVSCFFNLYKNHRIKTPGCGFAGRYVLCYVSWARSSDFLEFVTIGNQQGDHRKSLHLTKR